MLWLCIQPSMEQLPLRTGFDFYSRVWRYGDTKFSRSVAFCIPLCAAMSAFGSCPDRLLPLQNNGKPPFVQSTAQAQLLGSIGKGRYGGKEVAGSMGRRNTLI